MKNNNNNKFWKDYTEEQKTAYTAYLVTKVKSLLFELEDEGFRKEGEVI